MAICPGTYDPVTYGHLDIIARAANVFDRVIVGVVNQPIRKQQTVFNAEERKGFIEQAIADNGLGNVEVAAFSVLLVDFAREHGASAIVKGLRAISDFEYEFEMEQLNKKLAPEIESLYILASPDYSFISVERGEGDSHLRRRRLRPGPAPGRRSAGRALEALAGYSCAGGRLQFGAENTTVRPHFRRSA